MIDYCLFIAARKNLFFARKKNRKNALQNAIAGGGLGEGAMAFCHSSFRVRGGYLISSTAYSLL
ncbi:MAG: hypothetical protein FWF01_01240, partial [Alphaproteobacteria bacterium]|nr:hypothetical protein [Alphaproteobacteria bacterium]